MELKQIFPEGKILAADSCPSLSAACHMADNHYELPRLNCVNYTEKLLELCIANGVGMVVPTIDSELPILAQERQKFADTGIAIVVSGPSLVRKCRDKRLTHSFFLEHGVNVPTMSYQPSVDRLPLFAKPYDGSSSMGLHVLHVAEDLTPSLTNDRKMIFVDYLSPDEHDEYSIDAYFSIEGQLKCMVPRLRIETRAGEVSKGRTERPRCLAPLYQTFQHLESARGCLTIQVFVHRETGSVYGIEINPRFGGGFPLSYHAGANYPRWLIQEYLLGESIEFHDCWEANLTMLRYDEHVLVRNTAG